MAKFPEGSTAEVNLSSKAPEPSEFFHSDTLKKVFEALKKSGLNDDQALDAMREMQNAGILFRERFKL